MQLWKDGIEQGLGVLAIPGTERPKNLDGTLPGDIGFDPLGFSNVIDIKWLREAELKHARVAMLAFLGFIVQVCTRDLLTLCRKCCVGLSWVPSALCRHSW